MLGLSDLTQRYEFSLERVDNKGLNNAGGSFFRNFVTDNLTRPFRYGTCRFVGVISDLLMNKNDIVGMLEQAGIKPTPNRILVLSDIVSSDRPLSLSDIEVKLESLEKTSAVRVLTLLLDAGIIHAVEDGRGIVRYEICRGEGSCASENLHVHFYCESCNEVSCFESIQTPVVNLPEGYAVHSINYMIKGICPACRRKSGAI